MADPDFAAVSAAIVAVNAAADALAEARLAGGDPAELTAIAALVQSAADALAATAAELAAFEVPDLADDLSLPMTVGVDRVVTLIRDPESVFTYWELTPNGVGRAKGAHDGPSDLVLRTYIIADSNQPDSGPTSIRDLSVTDWLGRATIQVDQPGKRVVVAIGFKRGDVFAHVAQSTAVRLPRRSPGAEPWAFNDPDAPSAMRQAWINRPTIVHLASDIGTQTGPQLDPRINSAALRGYAQAQGMGMTADGVVSDLHRVVGSNHLIGTDQVIDGKGTL